MGRVLRPQMTGVKVVTPPSDMVISLNDAKRHLRFDSEEEDTVIRRLIRSSTKWAQTFLNRQLLTATLRQDLSGFPAADNDPIKLPRPPLQSITSINYYDEAGVLQLWADTEYQVDTISEPGRVMPVPSGSWPTTQDDRFGAVQITYLAGFTEKALIPENIITGMLMLLASNFQVRENQVITSLILRVPDGLEKLLYPERTIPVA